MANTLTIIIVVAPEKQSAIRIVYKRSGDPFKGNQQKRNPVMKREKRRRRQPALSEL